MHHGSRRLSVSPGRVWDRELTPARRTCTDPVDLFHGVVAIIAPHMDDEVLACGGTIARMPQKERVHLVYATDGSQSPVPPSRRVGVAAPELSVIRRREAWAALDILGVPDGNLHFLGFPDGQLRRSRREFGQALAELLNAIKPRHLLVPFRYDRHPDHVAVNRVATSVLQLGNCQAEMLEYFVYTNWRLLRKRDIRRYICPEHLIEIDIEAEASRKRRALACFKSQTTRFYAWQHRPILTQALLEDVCHTAEVFLKYNRSYPHAAIFAQASTWIRLAHILEPVLKRGKDRVWTLLHSRNRLQHENHTS